MHPNKNAVVAVDRLILLCWLSFFLILWEWMNRLSIACWIVYLLIVNFVFVYHFCCVVITIHDDREERITTTNLCSVYVSKLPCQGITAAAFMLNFCLVCIFTLSPSATKIGRCFILMDSAGNPIRLGCILLRIGLSDWNGCVSKARAWRLLQK